LQEEGQNKQLLLARKSTGGQSTLAVERHYAVDVCCGAAVRWPMPASNTEFEAIVAMLFVLLPSPPRMQLNSQALGTLMAGMYTFAKLLQLMRQHCRVLQ